ncbi:hypothetical protein M2281_002801 [Mesorhizobium soli]|uniref:chemotaxis protein CheW n=1 Tax=Pseudaminobacter soli (ex Li et al. 2025) TaxID=1295366 RepID=UPI00247CE70A|nr:hypothetical protein [Mesorhizobium soli]
MPERTRRAGGPADDLDTGGGDLHFERCQVARLGLRRSHEVYAITRALPSSNDHIKGCTIREQAAAARLGFAPPEPTVRHVIMMAQVGHQVVGLLVDAVSDILSVTDDAIQPTPDVASDMASSFVRGVLAQWQSVGADRRRDWRHVLRARCHRPTSA